MAVVFKTFDVIEIDGVPAGNIVDVISNHGPRRAEVLAAFGVYVAAINAEKATLVADLATKTTAYDAEVAKVTALEAEKATLTSDLATRTTELSEKTQLLSSKTTVVTALESQVESLTSQLQEVTESKDVLFVKKQAVDHDLVEANAKIAFLESIRQYNPRWTTPDYFINRFTAKEAKAFYSSEDAMIVGGQQLLEAYEAAGWYVDLDDTQVQGLTGYMVQLGMMTPERRAQVLRDVSAAEAWYPQ